MKTSASPVADSSPAVVVMAVRGALATLPVEAVIETMRPLTVLALGDAPPFVLGAAVVRGQTVPVLDLAMLLALSGSPTLPTNPRWVMIRVGERRAALAVDAVVGVQRVERAARSELPPLLAGADTRMVAGLQERDGALLLVLEAGRLVSQEQLEKLSAEGRHQDG